MTTQDRPKLVARVSKSLLQRGNPRLEMSCIVVLTGMAGFLASFGLLHLGLERMWLRYPVAVGFSYGVFFLLLRLWIASQPEERSLALDALDLTDVNPLDFLPDSGLRSSTGSGRSHSWSDLLPDLDADEYLVVVILLAALIAAAVASVFVVFAAPTLLGEVFLDAIVIAVLRKKMVQVAEQHWAVGAMRRTAVPFLTVALVFSLTGGIIQQVRPEAKSIGGILHAEKSQR